MARFPTLDELADLVHHYFDDKGQQVSYDPATGLGAYGEVEFSVHNLAANLAHIDQQDWRDYVAWHFGHNADGRPPEIPPTYAEVRKRLRIRLAADAWVDALRHREIARPVAEDLQAVLMISIDEGATSVPPDGQIQQVLSYQDGGLEPVRSPDFKEMLPELGPAVATTEAYDIS